MSRGSQLRNMHKENINMEINIRQMQKIQFDILRYLKEVCDNHGLRYYLAYGTLIGALRHEGFIPWDDDIDVHMPRKDYIRLVKIVHQNPHPYYKLVSRETNGLFTAPLPKMVDTRTKLTQKYGFIEKVQLGVYVDIFLLDGAGNTYEESAKRYKSINDIYRKWNHADTQLFPPGKGKLISLLKWVKHIPEKTKGIYYWLNKLETESAELDFDECKYVAAYGEGAPTVDTNVWPRSAFGNGVPAFFCGEEFLIPLDANKELTPIYGDYMKMPPVEKRISHHKYELEILDDSMTLEEL